MLLQLWDASNLWLHGPRLPAKGKAKDGNFKNLSTGPLTGPAVRVPYKDSDS